MVYLIHFDKPYKRARHYIGFVQHDLNQRLERHRKGVGAKLLRAVTRAGINWNVVKTWPDQGQTFERRMKNYKGARWFCPICCAPHAPRDLNVQTKKRINRSI